MLPRSHQKNQNNLFTVLSITIWSCGQLPKVSSILSSINILPPSFIWSFVQLPKVLSTLSSIDILLPSFISSFGQLPKVLSTLSSIDILLPSSSCNIQEEMVWGAWRHDDVIKWKHFPRYWPSVCAIHRSPVNSLHTGQWRRALMFSLICARINGWANNREAGNLRRHRAHYDVIVMNVFNSLPWKMWWQF